MRARRRGESVDARAWPIRATARPLLTVIVGFQLLGVAGGAAALTSAPLSAHSALLAALIIAIALGYEELMARAARMRLKLAPLADQDMQAVWGVACALALPRAAAVIVVTTLFTYTWFRQRRPAGKLLHRELFNASNALLSCLTAGLVFQQFPSVAGGSWAISHTLAAVCAIIAFTVTNRLIITCALVAIDISPRTVFGSRDENLVELATLSLGGLVALAVANEPLLTLLVLAPMVTLQRGAVARELETAATTDAKTGLLNAVAWEQIAARELTRAAREHTETAVLIIDVDHFKRVNDRFGHLAGDLVLKLIGQALSGGLREYDTVARFGGEEFVAVLPEAGPEAAVVVAERLRGRVNELWVSSVVDGLAPESDEPLAVSVGVSTCADGAIEVHQMLYSADAALYRAKAAGRNRVVLADAPDAGFEAPALAD